MIYFAHSLYSLPHNQQTNKQTNKQFSFFFFPFISFPFPFFCYCTGPNPLPLLLPPPPPPQLTFLLTHTHYKFFFFFPLHFLLPFFFFQTKAEERFLFNQQPSFPFLFFCFHLGKIEITSTSTSYFCCF